LQSTFDYCKIKVTITPEQRSITMELLFHDNDLAVCIKPVGLDSEHQVPAALSELLDGGFFPVHRLDLNVGGVMVYARNKAAAAALSRAIQDGSMVKEYVAMVHGTPPEAGDWEDLLWKDSSKNKVFVVKRMRGGVKKARLEFRRLSSGQTSLVRIRLHTGRSHQIRVQFSSRGFPLVGDRKYGSRSEVPSPMLYSCCLTFPFRGKTLCFSSFPHWADNISPTAQ
jgi:23S rRNA pseudouridine1911/1915/1917 synthase